MPTDTYDVVVVGAGVAGLCCAATLVEQGVSVALVAETPEVAWNLRPQDVGDCRAVVQFPVWQVAWGGGYWYPLARRLSVKTTFDLAPPLSIWFRGEIRPRKIPFCVSAAGLVDVIVDAAPFPIGHLRGQLERLLDEALMLEWADLLTLTEVPLKEWLADRSTDPMIEVVLYILCAAIMETTPELAGEHTSVYGLIGMLRGLLIGEAPCAVVHPDSQTGLWVPIAEAIDGLGGRVSRGRKVQELSFEGSHASGVILADGTELKARAIALAVGDNRLGRLLSPLPEPVQAALDYSALLGTVDVCTFSVLHEPVVDLDWFSLVVNEAGAAQAFLFPLHRITPWNVTPGMQLLAAQAFMPQAAFDHAGGVQGVAASLASLGEELFPGFTKATSTVTTQQHRHHWMSPVTHGPKIPRTVGDLPGVFFVGDGSAPVAGLGCDAAAGAGVLGARDILTALYA